MFKNRSTISKSLLSPLRNLLTSSKLSLQAITFLVLIAITTQSTTCQVDLDCNNFNRCEKGICQHKPYFPVTFPEILGSALLFLSSLLANASGIGGGGLYVPILILFNKFDLKDATPISKLMIFSGSLTAFIYNIVNNRHPDRGFGPTIDMTFVTYLIPFVILGNQLGVLLNILLPELLLLIIMILVLIASTTKTILNSIKHYNQETVELRQKAIIKEKKKLKLMKRGLITEQEYNETSFTSERLKDVSISESEGNDSMDNENETDVNTNNEIKKDRYCHYKYVKDKKEEVKADVICKNFDNSNHTSHLAVAKKDDLSQNNDENRIDNKDDNIDNDEAEDNENAPIMESFNITRDEVNVDDEEIDSILVNRHPNYK